MQYAKDPFSIMASSSESETDIAHNVLVKRKGKNKLYKNEIIKKARLLGDEYVNYKGAVVEAKEQGENCG